MSPSEIQQSLYSTAQRVSHASSKFQMAWKTIVEEAAASAVEDGSSFAQELEQELKNLAVAANVVIALNAEKWGQRVQKGVRDAVEEVAKAVETLILYFFQWEKGQADTQSAPLTAQVWERCKAVEKVPLDNNTAACNAIRNSMLMIKDAMNELGELASKNSKPKDKADEGANENIEEDEWDWDEDEELSEEEVKTVAGCQLLIKSLYGLLNGSLFLLDLEERQKDMMREIEKRQKNEPKTTGTDEIVPDGAEWLEAIIEKAQLLSDNTDELVICLYPPQDPDTIRQHASKLAQVGHSILDHLATSPEVMERERYGRLRKLLETMITAATTAIQC